MANQYPQPWSNIKAQFDSLATNIGAEEKRIKAALGLALIKVAEDCASRSVANAPILTGDLRAAIGRTQLVQTGDRLEIKVQVGAHIQYALKQHEDLMDPRHFGSGSMRLGPISVQQPMTPEGGAGGKFIERSAFHNAAKYTKFIKDEVSGKG